MSVKVFVALVLVAPLKAVTLKVDVPAAGAPLSVPLFGSRIRPAGVDGVALHWYEDGCGPSVTVNVNE